MIIPYLYPLNDRVMNSKEISRQEYTARINRVMDYVSTHLDQAFDLSTLAQIASFSPYHFHRIFTAMLGETPNSFVSRVRLEKSAHFLQNAPNLSVGEIAYNCGFNSISSFSRSFRKYFGIAAKDFRELDKSVYAKDGLRYSKNGELLSKNGKNIAATNDQFCSVELINQMIMDTKIEVKEMPKLNLIYCRHMGAFDQIGKAYEKLMKWAGPRGLLNFPSTKTVTVYHDDPAITAIDKVRQDACITVDGDVKVDGEIGKEAIPGGKYAVGRFEIGVTEFEKAWNTMCVWFTESGYQPGEGCTYELYHNDHMQHPERKFILDICIPVKPL